MYTFTYKRKFWPFKTSIHCAEGHSYIQQTDKMWVSTSTGGREIRNWSKCEAHLGPDWKVYVDRIERERIEQQAAIEKQKEERK